MIFTWDIAQGERQQGLDFVDNIFVKRINQGEFVKLFLMLQSPIEERC